MAKRPLALLLGITGDYAFAAGVLLLSLRRHSPHWQPDILIHTDGKLPPNDEKLLRELGAQTTPYTPPPAAYTAKAINQFSLQSLARFEGLLLLETYSTVIWLDVDIAVQGDISPLASRGPLAIAREDPAYNDNGGVTTAAVNVSSPVAGLDLAQPNCNSGVLVFQDTLPDPKGIYRECMDWLEAHADKLLLPDQSAINALVQKYLVTAPELVDFLPIERFNCHPRNPQAKYAAIAHMFGPFKTWYDGLTRCAFPEWDRDYAQWVSLGGTPWQGPVTNEEFMEGGAFHMLVRFFNVLNATEQTLAGLQQELAKERALRAQLEKTLHILEQRGKTSG
ncbi:glycosyltransferase [Desulfovibrio sp. OttesenSCG-928-O18]|nr:glycosyltransferase [Desulfovibrio sp. OttesenSCG-928-O18]